MLWNVKRFGELKFRTRRRPRAEGMTGAELGDERLDLGLDFGESERRGGLVDVRHIPVTDPFDPMGKTLEHHRPMLGLVERDHEGGLGEIGFKESLGRVAGEEPRDRGICESIRGMGRERRLLDVGTESSRLGPPIKPVPGSEEIEPSLRVTTPVKISGAEEKDGLPVFHGAQYLPGNDGNQLGNVKGLTPSHESENHLTANSFTGSLERGFDHGRNPVERASFPHATGAISSRTRRRRGRFTGLGSTIWLPDWATAPSESSVESTRAVSITMGIPESKGLVWSCA